MAVITATRPSGPSLAKAGPSGDLALVALAAAPLAIAAPIPTSIVALAVFGIAHTVLELRWVVARFKPVFTPAFTAALVVPATAIALARLTGLPRQFEIAAGFGLVAIGLAHARRTGLLSNTPVLVAGAVLAAGLVASLGRPGMYGIALAHLHNVVTGILLWHWTEDRRFRAGLVACFAVVPLFILSGAVDGLLPDRLAATGPAAMLTGAVTPPAWTATATGIRIVAVFAFLQLVHYGVWCWLLPRRSPIPAPPSTQTTAKAATAARRATPAVVAFATAVLALVFVTDYATGRTFYTTIATYHAYLELPVVLMLLGGARVPR